MTNTRPSSVAEILSADWKGFVEEFSEQRRGANSKRGLTRSSVLEEVEQERKVEFRVD
jgi:hypothetical protein